MQKTEPPAAWGRTALRAAAIAIAVAAVSVGLQAAFTAHPWERSWLVLPATVLVVAGFIGAEWLLFIRPVITGVGWFLFYALVLAAGAAVAFV